MEQGIFPTVLKLGRVVPAQKGDNNKYPNYRPISIVPVMSKIYEYVLIMKLSQYK